MPRKKKSGTREALKEISSNLHIEYINLREMVKEHDEFTSDEIEVLRDAVKDAREKIRSLLEKE